MRSAGWLAGVLCAALGAMALAEGVPDELLGAQDEVAIRGYNNELVSRYDPQADFRQMGRGVGMLWTETDAGPFPCTAFLVAPHLLLTNHHCGPGLLADDRTGATRILSVQWLTDFTEEGSPDKATFYEVNPEPVETSEPLDYLVLEVRGDPAETHPVLPLAPTPLRAGMPYWIIGHPLGEAQRISREDCAAADPPLNDNRLRHTCDTMGGNSGSPIIDASARKVVGLHNSGNSKIGINFGIPMSLILASSKVLKAEVEVGTLSLYPTRLTVGQELSVVADVPTGCVPSFVVVAPSGRLTPIPLRFFQTVQLAGAQQRYQISPGGRFGLVIEEQDEKGGHQFGHLCAPGPLEENDLKGALQAVMGELAAGTTRGSVQSVAGPVGFLFRPYEVF